MDREPSGRCPGCDATGAIGAPCPAAICRQRGYGFIPAEGLPADPARPRDPLLGLTIEGHLIAGLIGVGGFGRVYLALKQPLLMKTALKLLGNDALPAEVTSTIAGMFEAEARALALLQHPNIVRLLHFGSFLDRPFLVTEYIERGVTLEADLARRAEAGTAYGRSELADLLRQLLDGLAAAHEEGIVHRDLKPGNIMLQEAVGYPRLLRLLDFGLAKFLAGGHETRSSAGTPEYMAPEQIAREPLGPWTDLYAVGIIACELITGRLPFAAEDFQALAWRKLDPSTDPTADLAGLELPDEVLTFLRRALARDPARRYRDVAAMRLGLLPAIRALPATRAPLAARRHPVASADPTTTPVSSAPPRPISEERDLAFRRWLEREEQRLDRRR